MKIRFLQTFVALLTLAFARQLVAANITVTTSASPRIAGTASGGGTFPSGSSVTVTAAVTNEDNCYDFVAWTKAGVKVSTENPYTVTNATKSEALTATFAVKDYIISTASSPVNGGTTSGGGNKGCGTEATLAAHPKPGFAFVNWIQTGTIFSIPTATCKIPVTGDESWVATFKDIKSPTLKIISPEKNEAVNEAAFPIQGTAVDNASVAAVYYNLNGTGWVLANSTNSYSNWYAWVSLKPDAPNTVSAYAVDAAGNKTTNSVNFTCSAAGFAPLSIAGDWAGVTEGTNTQDSFLVSFDLASYARVSVDTNDIGEVGTYTYTLTGPNTAEFVPRAILPTPDTGSNAAVLEFTFTNAFAATYTNSSGGSGIINFSLAADVAPVSLDGATIVGTSYAIPRFASTNTFGTSTFTNETSTGPTTTGTYTFTKFTPIAGLLIETPTAPAPAVGTTDYIVLSFTTNEMPPTGNYNYQAVGSQAVDVGSFQLIPGVDDRTFLGPKTLSGLQVQVTPAGEPVFTRTYGNGTFASLSLKSANEPTDVGIYLANTRVSATTGTDKFMALAPPYAVGLDDDTLDLTFGAKSTYAYSVEGDSNEKGTAKYSAAASTVPEALTGMTVTATPTGGGKASVITFAYNKFNASKGAIVGDGTYTYAAYSPSMALVTETFLSGTESGKTEYFVLDFVTTTGGHFVYARPDSSVSGGWEFTGGQFTLSKSKL